MVLPHDDLRARARRLRLLLLDVDGVLTDGTVTVTAAGEDTKAFYIRDGAAIVWARRAGLEVGLLSGRPSAVTAHRARELGISLVSQGSAADKATAYNAILTAHGLRDDEVAYMADDVLDLPVLLRVGLSAAPADAVVEVQSRVHWLSAHPGGRGAVRELVELILDARGTWQDLVQSFLV